MECLSKRDMIAVLIFIACFCFSHWDHSRKIETLDKEITILKTKLVMQKKEQNET